jgi:hypothetical protein
LTTELYAVVEWDLCARFQAFTILYIAHSDFFENAVFTGPAPLRQRDPGATKRLTH